MGMTVARSLVIDYPLPILRDPITLFATRPMGTAPNMWVYVRVFGVVQWTIIWTLMTAFVISMTITSSWREGQGAHSLKHYVLEVLGSAFLFTIQKGEHPNVKHFRTRLLTMTAAMLTLLLFIYFCNDITAEMTAGPSPIPIKTFEDVIHHEYRVAIQ